MKSISGALAAIIAAPTQHDPELKLELFDIDGTTLLGELNWKSCAGRKVDGDLAGAGNFVVFDPDRLCREWRVLRLSAGFAGELIPCYRGRIRDVIEDVPVPGQTTVGCVEGMAELFAETIITPFFGPDYSGPDGLHTGEWKRSEIAAAIAVLAGFTVGTAEPSITEVEQPPIVGDTVGDAIAQVLMPEFMKARIDEAGDLAIFKARLTGAPDITFTQGLNLIDLDSPSYRIEPMVTEILIEGISGDDVQVASPPAEIHEATLDIDAGEVTVLKAIPIPQSKLADTLTFSLCIDEPDGYEPEVFAQQYANVGCQIIRIDFRAPNGKHLWAVKDVFIRQLSQGGDPAGRFNVSNAYIFFADGTMDTLFAVFGGGSGNLTNYTAPKPVMGIAIAGFSGNRNGQPRNATASIDMDFTRITEREMVDEGLLKTDFVNQGGGTQIHTLGTNDCGTAYTVFDHGAKTAGSIAATKDIPTTTEFNLGIRTTSTWEFDTIKAEIHVHGQIWSEGRAEVKVFREIDIASEALFGTRQLYIQNPSIATEVEATAIADVLAIPLSTVRGQGIAEFSWTAMGHPHAEPGDLAQLVLTDPVMIDSFGTLPLIYIQEVEDIGDVDDNGAVQYMTRFRGIQADQAGIAVFKNLSVDLVKERSDIQSRYLSGNIKVRILRVRESGQGGVVTSTSARTDPNTYDVELLSEPGRIVERVPNAFPDPYVATDVALLQFQQGSRSFPWLVGRPHSAFATDPADTRDPGDGPPLPPDPCIYIVTDSFLTGQVGVPYSAAMTSDSGQYAVTWAWALAYGTLPPGITVQNSGIPQGSRPGALIGTPTLDGSYQFGLVTYDDRGNRAVRHFVITVIPA